MSLEEPIEVGLVGFCEMIRPAQKREAGPEQVRFVCWGAAARGRGVVSLGVPG